MRRRQALFVSLAALTACTPAANVPPIEVGEVVVADAGGAAPVTPPPEKVDVRALLAPYVVLDVKAARRTLWTWTTREQAEQLERDKTLLTKSESETKGASYFDQILAVRASQHSAIASLLKTPPFAKARFAWSAPWATALGWPGETYGDQLIGVVLKPDAWIVKMRTTSSVMEVVDLQDRPVTEDAALASPERIAAVYFVNDTYGSGYNSYVGTFTGNARTPFREFVLCNESMIESWSLGTPAETELMVAASRAISALADHVAASGIKGGNAAAALQRWRSPKVDDDPVALYEASLAIPNASYTATVEVLRELAKKLGELPGSGPKIEYRPTAVFPRGQAVVPGASSSTPPKVKTPIPKPKIPKPRMGTF